MSTMLSHRIKKLREKTKLTQEALARKADVSYNTIIKLETNGIKDPRVSTVIKLANALGVSIDKLLTKE
ncbi:MAG: helix-turn-helix transcriptional regulator [Candidatus Omnitrophota bacterium]